MMADVYRCPECTLLTLVDSLAADVLDVPMICGHSKRQFVGTAVLTLKEPVPQSVSTEGEDVADQG